MKLKRHLSEADLPNYENMKRKVEKRLKNPDFTSLIPSGSCGNQNNQKTGLKTSWESKQDEQENPYFVSNESWISQPCSDSSFERRKKKKNRALELNLEPSKCPKIKHDSSFGPEDGSIPFRKLKKKSRSVDDANLNEDVTSTGQIITKAGFKVGKSTFEAFIFKNNDNLSKKKRVLKEKDLSSQLKIGSPSGSEQKTHLMKEETFISPTKNKKKKNRRENDAIDDLIASECTELNKVTDETTENPQKKKKRKKPQNYGLPDVIENFAKSKKKKIHKETERNISDVTTEGNENKLSVNSESEEKSPKKKKRKLFKSDQSITSPDYPIISKETNNKSKIKGSNILEDEHKNTSKKKKMKNTDSLSDSIENKEISDEKSIKKEASLDTTPKKKVKKSVESPSDENSLGKSVKKEEGNTPKALEAFLKNKNHKKKNLLVKPVKLKTLISQLDNKAIADRLTKKVPRRKYSILLEKKLNQKLEDASEAEDASDDDLSPKDLLTKEETQKLANLTVILPWPSPALHLIETRVAGRPTPEQRKKIDALKAAVKTGIFSQVEDNRIKQNWEEFCRLHDWPRNPTPFLDFGNIPILTTLERIKFVRFLAHGLQNRLLCSVYKRFRRIFLHNKHKAGRFTLDEDCQILEFIKKSSSRTPYADLAQLLNRDKLSVQKRCMTLAKYATGEDAMVQWNKATIGDFMSQFVDIVGCDDVKELERKEISSEQWKEMENRLKIPSEKLRRAWYHTIYPRIMNKSYVNTKDIKECVLDVLIENGAYDWRNVNWDKIAEKVDGFNGKKLNKMIKQAVNYYVPGRTKENLRESLDYLKNVFLRESKFRGKKVKVLKVVIEQID